MRMSVLLPQPDGANDRDELAGGNLLINRVECAHLRIVGLENVRHVINVDRTSFGNVRFGHRPSEPVAHLFGDELVGVKGV